MKLHIEDLKDKLIAAGVLILFFFVGSIIFALVSRYLPRYIVSFLNFLGLIGVIVIGITAFIVIVNNWRTKDGLEYGESA